MTPLRGRLPAVYRVLAASLVLAPVLVFVWCAQTRRGQVQAADKTAAKKLDPAAWGSDHVGQPVPQFTESGECLFCHRLKAGVTWGANKHNRTVRDADATEPSMVALRGDAATRSLADEVTLIMGDTRAQRFLKRAAAYGKADLLSVRASLARGRRPKLDHTDKPAWEENTFAEQCAGCHMTGVDPETHAFTLVSLDCFACHGDSDPDHANDTKLILLSEARHDPAAVVTSICASCHVRFGKSKASGLPYPTNFVPGDNLFKDFEVDWAKADDPKLNPADRHVMENVRDVVINGNESVTCLSCHDVHNNVTKKHHDLKVTEYCQHCHDAGAPIKEHKTYEVHSERCQY